MNPKSDINAQFQSRPSNRESGSLPTQPTNWKEALLILITSRISLIELESKDAIEILTRRIILWVTAIVCACFSWALILAGSIAAIAEFSNCKWYWIALTCATAHLAAALILTIIAKRTTAPTFPFSRAEFKKDREWIVKL